MISLLMITKNSGGLLENSLNSVKGLVDEIIVVDDYSTDNTLEIAKKFKASMFQNHNEDLGKQRALGLSRCKGDWIFMLDADEIVSSNLRDQISNLHLKTQTFLGFYIPYQNHFLGRPINYGGENYKILRLFKKDAAVISDNVIHEHVQIKGKVGFLTQKIYHYSYRTFYQIFMKFTDYAHREAQRKIKNGEKTSIAKLIFYPPHMFWARYVKDKGYKDYYLRILLDLGFAYMEFLTYFFMFFIQDKSKKT